MPYVHDYTSALRPDEWIFSLALDARVAVARMWLYVTSGDVGCDAFDGFRHEAWVNAGRVGYHFADEPIPVLLQGDCELEDAWAFGRAERQRERDEAALEVARAAISAEKERLVAARDWAALKLPTPDELHETLASGKSTHVDGHYVVFRDGVIWITNPYGHDDTLGNDLTVEILEEFLAELARGHEYGAVPIC
ncbi:hypothetical protein [Paraburkholderia youngii]|uniref:hypothetical protein n=1 Tax=Paraburkholderia youngii TaxID=2782701 RepID=UPI003D1CD379